MRILLVPGLVCITVAAFAAPVDTPTGVPAILADAKASSVYVKILWPVDPAVPLRKNRPRVESWIAEGLSGRPKVEYAAVSNWVTLAEKRDEITDYTEVWDGMVDEESYACSVNGSITERKNGLIKILINGWGPGIITQTLSLDDEPGSRKITPVTTKETKLGIPHVAVFIGLPTK